MANVVLKEDLNKIIVGVAMAETVFRVTGGDAEANLLATIIKHLGRLPVHEVEDF